MKILITGGHITPALAVADELLKHPGGVELVFVGRAYTASKTDISMEYKEVMRRNVPFIHLKTGRMTRRLSTSTIRSIATILPGFARAWSIVHAQKPDCVLSFGGYIALPIAIAAWLQNIPIYTHEQTIMPGQSNRLIAKVSKKVFVSFPETTKYFDEKKVIVSGNPVRNAIFHVNKKIFQIPSDRPVIYITGGSLGAHSVNVHIEQILQTLLASYTLIHQTGNVGEYDDFSRLTKQKDALPSELSEHYFLAQHILEDELGYIFQKTDLVVSRSGANTFFELIALEKPAVLIPLPWSAGNEQLRHAQILEDAGVGRIFNQHATSDDLLQVIHAVLEDIDKYKQNFHKLRSLYHFDATQIIAKEILKENA